MPAQGPLVEVYIEARVGWTGRTDGLIVSAARPIAPEPGAVIYLAKIPVPVNHAPNPVLPVGVESLEEVSGENGIGV